MTYGIVLLIRERERGEGGERESGGAANNAWSTERREQIGLVIGRSKEAM